MRMRSHRRDMVVWEPSVGSADRYGTARFTRILRTAGTHRRPIFLVAGMVLLAIGLMLPDTMAFVPGMLVLGLSVPESRLHSPTTAMVRGWLLGSKADHL